MPRTTPWLWFDTEAEEAANFYVWDSEDAAKAFFTDELLERVTGLYGVRPTVQIVQIATLGGVKATVNIAKVMVKRLHHTGSTLRPRTNADKAAMVAAIEAKVMPLMREGRVKPVMDSTFPLEKAADAHRRMETSAHIGKIVLAV